MDELKMYFKDDGSMEDMRKKELKLLDFWLKDPVTVMGKIEKAAGEQKKKKSRVLLKD